MNVRLRWSIALAAASVFIAASQRCWADPPAAADAKDDPNIIYLSPNHDLWIDKKQHEVVVKGKVEVREGNLEMLACPAGTKDYESIVAVATKAQPIHAALLAVGAKPGRPMRYDSRTQKTTPASGSEIDVLIRWTDDKGKHETRGQDWVRNIKTHKALEFPWVFGGSILATEDDGKTYYEADGGDLISVANFPDSMMDLPIDSPKAWADHVFEPFTERIPPKGTAVELVLKPKAEKAEKKTDEAPK